MKTSTSPLLSGPQPCSPSFGQSVPLGAGGGAQDPKPPHRGDTESGRPPYNCTPSQGKSFQTQSGSQDGQASTSPWAPPPPRIFQGL